MPRFFAKWLPSFLRSRSSVIGRGTQGVASNRRSGVRLAVEALEDRTLPSTAAPFDFGAILAQSGNAAAAQHVAPSALVHAPDGVFNRPIDPTPLPVIQLTGGADMSIGITGNEPTIAVNPLNANNVVVAQYNNGQQTLKISLDGGASFSIQRNAVLPSGQTFFDGDDSLAFDSQGRLFWTYLTGAASSGPNVVALQVNSTTGDVIGSPTFVGTGDEDKAWIAADQNPVSPFHDNLYVVWHDFNQSNGPVRFARSSDQGVTWTTFAGNLSGAAEGFTWPSEVAVGPNGDVWAAWHTNTGATNGEVRMRRSTDGGLTFGAEIIPFPAGTAATTTNSATGLVNKITGLHVWLQGSMQPRILIDPVRAGNLYIVSVDDPDGFVPTNDPSDIVLARSTDNGATWTRSTFSQGAYGDSEIMPAAAIDASGSITVTWYDNRRHVTVPDSLGGTHYLLDLYSTASIDGGLSFSPPLQVNDPANPFDPERGAPDRFNNHTLRIGEYNGLAVANETAYAVWTGNSATGQQTFFDKFSLALFVTSTTPAAGSVVATPPTTFTVNVNWPIDPASLAASDFTVNGIAASSFSYTPGATTISFVFTASPVTVQGVQTMHLDAGAFTRASDGSPVSQFDATFSYSVTSTNTFTNSTAAAIKDPPLNSVTRSTLNVSLAGTNSIVDLDVTVNITHANVGDLQIVLKSPQGVAVTLALNNGGTGDNFAGTIFDDSASQSINQGTAPFTGHYRVTSASLQTLSVFNGGNPNGAWSLEVKDTVKNKIVGTLTSWKLIFTTTATGGAVGGAAQTPSLSVSPVTETAGNSGMMAFVFTVTLSAASTQNVTVNYATAGNTSQTGTITFAAGQTSKTITILVKEDKQKATDKAFLVNLSDALNATIVDGLGL